MTRALSLATRAARALRRAAAVARRILGAPDYDAYVAHVRARHGGMPVLSREEFMAARLRERYERPGAKCC